MEYQDLNDYELLHYVSEKVKSLLRTEKGKKGT